MSDAKFLDASGHLNPAGLRALQSAVPGQAPPEIARHLAGCTACQARLLEASSPGPRPRSGRKPRAVAPSPGRTALLLGLTLAFILIALWSLRRLVQP